MMNNPELNGNQKPASENNEWIEAMSNVKPFNAKEKEKSQEKVLDPRAESLAIPLARDYAEKITPNVKMELLNQPGVA